MSNSLNLATDFDDLAELLAFDFSNFRKGSSGPLVERATFSTVGSDGTRAVVTYVRAATAGGQAAIGGGRLFVQGGGASAVLQQQTMLVDTDYSVSSGAQVLTFDSATGDAVCGADPAAGEFRPTEKGYYQLHATRNYTSTENDSMLYADVFLDGVSTTYRATRGNLQGHNLSLPPVLLDPATNDFIRLRTLQSTSGTVRAAAGSNYWTWATLTRTDPQASISSGGGATIYGAEKLKGETLAASQASISIPVSETYDLIEGDLSLRTDKVSVEFPAIVINGDANNANYDRHSLNGDEANASVIGVAGSRVLFPVGYAGTQGSHFAATRVRIFEPAAARFKIVEIFGFTAYDATNPNDREIRIGTILWKSTAPITSIAFEGGAGDDFQAGSSYLFKGWRDLPVGGGGNEEPYAAQELSANAPTFPFSGITQTGRHLRFKARLRSDVAGVAVSIYCYVNGNFVDADYHYDNLQSLDGTVGGDDLSEPRIGLATGSTAPAGSYADVEIKIDFYSKAAFLPTIKGFSEAYRSAGQIQQTRRTVVLTTSPQAVNDLEIRCGGGANFVAGSIVEMYVE